MPNPYDPVENVTYMMMPSAGLRGDRKYLSTKPDGSSVDLSHQVDPQGPGRQHWLFVHRPEKGDNVYEILIERLWEETAKAQRAGRVALRAAWATGAIATLALAAMTGFWLATIGHS